MTTEDMIAALEILKDSFNDARRGVLTEIQNSLRFISAEPLEKIVEREKIVEKPVEKIVEVEKPVPVPASGDRRDEPRDPGEVEQHMAEKLHLV